MNTMMQQTNKAGAVARKVMALTLALMAIVTATLSTAAAQNSYLVPVSSRAGAFSALMPGAAQYSSKPVTIKDGSTVTLHQFSHETADRRFAYIVMYSDYANGIATGGNLDGFFQEVAQGGAKGINGQILKIMTRTQNGYPARLVKYENSDYTFYNQMILAGRRFYQVIFVMPKGASVPDAAERFYESFRIG